jgi:Protein of unknown function (DUF3105)
MAKRKPRTPPPPRPVHALTDRLRGAATRSSAPVDDLGRRHRTILYALSAVGIVALIVAVAFVELAGGDRKEQRVATLMSAAGCTFRTVKAYVPPGQGVHVPSLTKKFPWNTNPPSNGQHYPLWAVWGFYTEPVNPRMVVHNEEHGGVVLWWGDRVPASTIAALHAFYDEVPDGSFGTPYPELGSRVAISAWTGNPVEYGRADYWGQGHLAICPRYDPATKEAFEAFRALYRGHGPEGIPLSADEPGMGPSS